VWSFALLYLLGPVLCSDINIPLMSQSNIRINPKILDQLIITFDFL
jgi:hypothetical protein